MNDQTKGLRGGAVEVCPECDIAGCRHIRARAALAAQPAALDWSAINAIIARHFGDDAENACCAQAAIYEVLVLSQPAASAEPSDEELAQIWRQVSGRETLRPDSVAMTFARALLSRYGRPAGDAELLDALRQIAAWPDGGERYGQEKIKRFAQDVIDAARAPAPEGDAQPVAIVKENPYCPEGLSDEINEYLPNGTVLYAAPVAAQKADDTRDAERWREFKRQFSMTAESLGPRLDAAIAKQRKGE